jgi:hypothetical protein
MRIVLACYKLGKSNNSANLDFLRVCQSLNLKLWEASSMGDQGYKLIVGRIVRARKGEMKRSYGLIKETDNLREGDL